jgi:hypothetical protein
MTKLGLPGKPLNYPFRTPSQLIIDSWWKDVWREMDTGVIRLDTQATELPLQRTNDMFLMKAFLGNGFTNN